MRQTLTTGLLGAGNVSRSWICRIPGLAATLGPVKSTSLRLASRISNMLRCGTAVEGWEALAAADIILIRVPDTQLPGALRDLAENFRNWEGKSVVLCHERKDSRELRLLAERGAWTASLGPLGESEHPFVFEGHPAALRHLEWLWGRESRSLVEVAAEQKVLISGALTILLGTLTPLFSASLECLRLAGLSHERALAIQSHVVTERFRSWSKAGRRSWTGALAEGAREQVLREWSTIRQQDPELADFYLENAILAIHRFGPDYQWIAELSGLPRRQSAAQANMAAAARAS